MDLEEVNHYLRQHIPLTRHMGMEVRLVEADRIEVSLPLKSNLNPHGTVFGGALSALGLLTGWVLIYLAFERKQVSVNLVGAKSETSFLTPARGDCVAECTSSIVELDRVVSAFEKRGKAVMKLDTRVRVGNSEVAIHHGVYAAKSPF